MIEELRKLKINDLLDIDASRLTADEVAYIEKRLVKEANRRLSRLRKAKKLSASKTTKTERKGFKSYKVPKGYKPSKTGSNRYVAEVGRGKRKKDIDIRNKKVANISKVQDFLKKKTTRLRELSAQEKRYQDVISKAVGKDVHLTSRQMKRISRLMDKAQELAGLDPNTKKTVGSPRLLAIIVEAVKSRRYIKNDDIEKVIMSAITEGYEKAQQIINDLRNEDAEGLEIDSDDDVNN